MDRMPSLQALLLPPPGPPSQPALSQHLVSMLWHGDASRRGGREAAGGQALLYVCNPLCLSQCPVVQALVRPAPKPPTQPAPFHLVSVERHEEEVARRQQELEAMAAEEEEQRHFHARPMPDYEAL